VNRRDGFPSHHDQCVSHHTVVPPFGSNPGEGFGTDALRASVAALPKNGFNLGWTHYDRTFQSHGTDYAAPETEEG
jgi:hypothetical protein